MKKLQQNSIISIKNNALLNKTSIKIVYNLKTLKLIKILYQEGFVQTYSCSSQHILVGLRYCNEESFFNKVKIFSKASKKTFLSYKAICKLSKSYKTFLFSTDKGLCNQLECLKKKKGGQLLFTL